MEESIMENIFKKVKNQYLSDVKYAFDIASELLDKLNEKYPNAKLDTGPFGNLNIRIMFMMNKDTRLRIEYLLSRYDTGAPGLAVSLEVLCQREQQGCPVYTKEISIRCPEYFQTIVTISMDRYEKVVDIYDKAANYAAFESDANALIDLMKEIDSKLDKGSKEFKIIKSSDRRNFDDYLD
jgi:hypothetical protein